jgi:hypothetical protein
MPPRIGRPRYDLFRADEVAAVTEEVRRLVDKEDIREKQLGGRGRPPIKKRDILKCLLALELLKCQIQKAPSLLPLVIDQLGLEAIPAPRTLYKYRAMRSLSLTLERLQVSSAREEWMKEEIAATDATGNPRSKGKTWSGDRSDPRKYREYDKAHYIVGTKSLVIPASKVTRGTWSERPEFGPLMERTIPGSNISVVTADPGYVDNKNYELSHSLGVTPYIKPKDNAVFRPHPSNAYEQTVFFATRFPDKWKSVYRWRVKAECAIHAKKAAFGDIIRGRLPSSRRNQELCRDIVHNLRMTVMARYGG